MAKTYNELYLAMRRALKEAGVEEYALEARRLLAQGAGYTDAQLIARMYMYAGDEAEKATGVEAARGPGRRLHGAIAHKLGTAILSGQYQPGDVLSGEVPLLLRHI